MRELPIIISGGGIGGLTAAIALARAGCSVAVFERAPRFEPIGYGIQIGPNALHVFEHLDLLKEVLSHCSLPEAGLLSDALTNDVLARLPMAGYMKERFGHPYAVIHRGDLHQVLVGACAASPLIELRNNVDIVSFEDAHNEITVDTKDGNRISGAALIGADGIWSATRNHLFPDCDRPRTSRYVAFRCLRPIAEIEAGLAKNVVNLRCGATFHMIHYPLRNDSLFNLVVVMRVPESIVMEDFRAVDTHFKETFNGACDEVHALLRYVDRSKLWPISNLAPLRTWTRGKVALLGDAAHAMVQAMAQGACQAVEDGFVLAKHVAACETIESAFQLYQAERHTRATFTQFRSLYMWELIHASEGWREMRKNKLSALSDAETLSYFDWLYSAAPGSELGKELAEIV
jgi:salicylate hydroxylase